MVEMLSPGVYPVEVDFSAYVRAISTSTFGMVGVFEKGPIGEAVLVSSLAEAQETFGGYVSGHFGMLALKSFFENGGSRAYVVRTVRYADGAPTAERASYVLQDREDGSVRDTVRVEAHSAGAWGNRLQVRVEQSALYPSTGFSLVVAQDGAVVERFPDLLVGEAHVGSEDHVEQRVNGVSQFVRVTDLFSESANAAPAVGSYDMEGGTDGVTGIAATDFIGSQAASSGLYALDVVNVNFIAIPGEASPEVAGGLITYAEGRKDCVALIDVPQGLTAQEAANYRKGEGTYSHAAFDSSYAAMYGPWLEALHPVTARPIVIPPTGVVAGIFARNDAEGAVWTAPAGLNRATVRGVQKAERLFSKGDRDILSVAGVNPIATVAGSLSVQGQKTLQLCGSATDRVNVRRLMAHIEKAISDSSQFLVFEANNKQTWEAFKRQVGPFLQDIKDRGGFYDFLVICDETTNTPVRIDRNEMHARILVKPTKTAEFIAIEFAIAGTGADFSEL